MDYNSTRPQGLLLEPRRHDFLVSAHTPFAEAMKLVDQILTAALHSLL